MPAQGILVPSSSSTSKAVPSASNKVVSTKAVPGKIWTRERDASRVPHNASTDAMPGVNASNIQITDKNEKAAAESARHIHERLLRGEDKDTSVYNFHNRKQEPEMPTATNPSPNGPAAVLGSKTNASTSSSITTAGRLHFNPKARGNTAAERLVRASIASNSNNKNESKKSRQSYSQQYSDKLVSSKNKLKESKAKITSSSSSSSSSTFHS